LRLGLDTALWRPTSIWAGLSRRGHRRTQTTHTLRPYSSNVNNIAYALMIMDFLHQTYLPTLTELVEKLVEMARQHARTPRLARIHVQPTVPTTLGSLLAKYTYSLVRPAEELCNLRTEMKLGGQAFAPVILLSIDA
jgi:fumarate hydratase class II